MTCDSRLGASDLAAKLTLAHFESAVSAALKADGTQVTEADGAVERLLRKRLSRARPEDAFLGEELGRSGDSDRLWILDPIDGTRFFSRGDPNWRIHVALEVAGSTRLAVVTSPALRRCWCATRGGGAFESSWPREEGETRRLKVSATATPAQTVPRSGDASVVQQEHFLAYQRGQARGPWVQITLSPATGRLPGHGDAEHRRDRVG
jgi:histidinol-phosphatase